MPPRPIALAMANHPRLEDYDEESRLVVSEPLGNVAGVWNPVPEATCGVVQPGPDELSTFRPAAPVSACGRLLLVRGVVVEVGVTGPRHQEDVLAVWRCGHAPEGRGAARKIA